MTKEGHLKANDFMQWNLLKKGSEIVKLLLKEDRIDPIANGNYKGKLIRKVERIPIAV